MSTQTFLSIVFVVILPTLGILIIDQYWRCVELGYIDCPRMGRGGYRNDKKRSAVPDRLHASAPGFPVDGQLAGSFAHPAPGQARLNEQLEPLQGVVVWQRA